MTLLKKLVNVMPENISLGHFCQNISVSEAHTKINKVTGEL